MTTTLPKYLSKSLSLINWGAQRILDVVLPPRCPVTGELVGIQGTLHPAFWTTLNFIHAPMCACCSVPFAHEATENMLCANCLHQPPLYHAMRCVWRYDDASAALILKFKHADALHLTPLLGGFLSRSGAEILQGADLLLPVPLHRWRLLKRKYNQAGLLAKFIARENNIPCAQHLLRRRRATESQGSKTRVERHENLRDAFHILPKHIPAIAGKNIVLIDDVYTSGATIGECTKLLLAKGAAQVDVLCLARIVHD
jgi:ComF family protein